MAVSSPPVTAKARRGLPILQGVLPIDTSRIGPEVVAGITLAALGIPEVMGYTKIAGMPVVTGLYTILIPIAIFAILCSSRHLVVGADSATAAIMAAGLVGFAAVAPPESANYIQLAGVLAIMTAGFLILARIIKLGFLADFLSRSVLIGFLTGVGIQVAMGQVGGMFGVPSGSGGTVSKFVGTLQNLGETSWWTVAVTVGVLGTIMILKRVNEKIPGALFAVIGAIVISYVVDLNAKGVAILGPVPGGLPSISIPTYGWQDWQTLLPTAAAMFVVILAQSAATARAYAARYSERFDENLDLVGLGGANIATGLIGAFVVNGSPTKSQMVNGAGGRSQLAMLVTAGIVLIVLLFLTKPLEYMPSAVLSSIVFMIGIELVDIKGMRRILDRRMDEFVIAFITAATVVVVGVEQGVILAMVLSAIDHLRFSYRPRDAYVVPGPEGTIQLTPVNRSETRVEARPGLVIFRFAASLYYANTEKLTEDVRKVVGTGPAPAWFCLHADAVNNIDYSAGEAVKGLHAELKAKGTRLVIAEAFGRVREELEVDGTLELLGADGVFDSLEELIEAYDQRPTDPPAAAPVVPAGPVPAPAAG
ncbi:MAG: SulP family inorganic anion transporter [Chloroflexota bacterium]